MMAELRGQWSYQSRGDLDDCGIYDGEITVTVQPNGVLFSVEEECAVDSYNQLFNCSSLVPLSEIDALIALLNRARPLSPS
jgi:hypothetical protein